MVSWSVCKYIKDGGRCPIQDWLESNAVTKNDQIRLEARIDAIEGVSGALPPEHVKQYHGTRLHELKVRSNGKQLRPLCWVQSERRIVILCGAIEKDGKIPKGDLERADNLLSELLNGKGNVRRYFEDKESVEKTL